MLDISRNGAGALPSARQHDLGQGGAALDEVREEVRLLGRSGPDPEYERLLARMQRGVARHGFASSESDEERLALNANRQAKQLRAWQGLERRLTARRNLALKKLSDIRAITK